MTRMVQAAVAGDITEAEEIQDILRSAGMLPGRQWLHWPAVSCVDRTRLRSCSDVNGFSSNIAFESSTPWWAIARCP